MELEEILRKYIEAKELLEDNELMVSAGFVEVDGNKDSRAAIELLARTTKADAEVLAQTTKADADLLAKATRADAEVLAKATQVAADQLKKSNESSVRWMTWLTIAILTVGLIQIVIAAIPFFKK